MLLLWTIFSINICSLLFLVFCLQRVFHYLKRYRMQENRFTLLFGFISLKQVLFVYAACVIVFAVFSTLYTFWLT